MVGLEECGVKFYWRHRGSHRCSHGGRNSRCKELKSLLGRRRHWQRRGKANILTMWRERTHLLMFEVAVLAADRDIAANTLESAPRAGAVVTGGLNGENLGRNRGRWGGRWCLWNR